MEFTSFPKVARLSRPVIVTEKIDGSNASIAFKELDGHAETSPLCCWQGNGLAMFVGSRNGWITPAADNFNFAEWAIAHAEDLASMGPGQHYGEWWGMGIQRKYGLNERRFSLFNRSRWRDTRPACCHVVPELWRGNFDQMDIQSIIATLRETGSIAAPGFMKPEGVMVYHGAANIVLKKTLERDEEPKGKQP